MDVRKHRGIYYLDFLALLNCELRPRSYFEIGTSAGLSLNCFTCDAVCVDPEYQIASRVWQKRRRTLMSQSTPDDFFADEDLRTYFPTGPDIAFLDGLHRAECLLRDFMNTEQAAYRRTLEHVRIKRLRLTEQMLAKTKARAGSVRLPAPNLL